MNLFSKIYQFKKSVLDAKIKYMHYKLIINMLIFFGQEVRNENIFIVFLSIQLLIVIVLKLTNFIF